MNEDEKKTEKRTDNEYFAEVNPKNNLRFDIPMLMGNDPQYFVRYVKYMKLKEEKPDEFQRIMNWG